MGNEKITTEVSGRTVEAEVHWSAADIAVELSSPHAGRSAGAHVMALARGHICYDAPEWRAKTTERILGTLLQSPDEEGAV